MWCYVLDELLDEILVLFINAVVGEMHHVIAKRSVRVLVLDSRKPLTKTQNKTVKR